MTNILNRIEKLEAALETARASERRASKLYSRNGTGARFYMEARAIRQGIQTQIEALENEIFDVSGFEIAQGEFVPVSDLIDASDRF